MGPRSKPTRARELRIGVQRVEIPREAIEQRLLG